jgi:hypothetical protein
MSPKILYKYTPDRNKVRYAEYETRSGNTKCEILLPTMERLQELRALLAQGEIVNLVTKYGVCWAEYNSMDGNSIHTLLKYRDFDESTPFSIEQLDGWDGKPEITSKGEPLLTMYGGNEMQQLRFRVERGYISDFDIKFGPKLPKDYFGNYDYSFYPGGYGPHEAFYGDD